MSYRSVAASVAKAKEAHPEQFCPTSRCLWRTGGGLCPRHGGPSKEPSEQEDASPSERPPVGAHIVYSRKVGAFSRRFEGEVIPGQVCRDTACSLVHARTESGAIHHVPMNCIRNVLVDSEVTMDRVRGLKRQV